MMNVEGELLVLKERIVQLQRDREDRASQIQKDKEEMKEEIKDLKVIIYDTKKELQIAKDNFMLQKAAYDKLIAKGAGIALALTTLGTLVGWLWSNFVPKGH